MLKYCLLVDQSIHQVRINKMTLQGHGSFCLIETFISNCDKLFPRAQVPLTVIRVDKRKPERQTPQRGVLLRKRIYCRLNVMRM